MNRIVVEALAMLVILSIAAYVTTFQPAEAQSRIVVSARRVLFDMLHVEQFRFYSDYSILSDELNLRNHILYQIGREQSDVGQLTYDVLENFDVLVLPNPQSSFASSETQVIIDFVENGGGLLVLGGSYPVMDSDYPVKNIIRHFGIEYEEPMYEPNNYVTNMSSHSITRNVTSLYMPFVKALNTTLPACGVAFSEGKPVVSVAEYGNGRVVVIAAEHMLANWAIVSYDNLPLALNSFEWLSERGGEPYPQELPLVKITSWDPPTDMVVNTSYAINVMVQNNDNEPVDVVVTIPNDDIFDEAGTGSGYLVGDSKNMSISPRAAENLILNITAPTRGLIYMKIYVYAPYDSSYIVFDGKSTERIFISAMQRTVYIRANGSIDPPTAPISRSGSVYTLTGNIISDASGIVVERDNIVVDGSGFAVEGTGAVSSQGIGLYGRSLVTIQNTTIKNFYSGIWLGYSTNNSVIGNTITNNSDSGIWLDYFSNYNNINGNTITDNNKGIWLGFSSDYNSIVENTLANNNYGFRLEYSWNNSIIRNIISNNNLYGIWLYGSSYNIFCHNNFVNNTRQAKPIGSTSFWDNGCEGNYWSDYNGTDLDNDGVGDTSLPWEGVDNCPLMNIYWNPCDTNHDLHVDMRDLSISAEAFDSSPADPFWNPHADITGPEQLVPDGKVNIRDTGLIGRHFEQHYH